MSARHHFPASYSLTASHYYVCCRGHRIGTYDWPTAVSEFAAMMGAGVDATVIQTLRNMVQIDVTAEALADWCGDDAEDEEVTE